MGDKKHVHKFDEIKKWLTEPYRESDLEYHFHFRVSAKCACGEEDTRFVTREEMQTYIADHKCEVCGSFGKKHTTSTDCFKAMRERIASLEDVVDKMRDMTLRRV
jgi:hypothetical protein